MVVTTRGRRLRPHRRRRGRAQGAALGLLSDIRRNQVGPTAAGAGRRFAVAAVDAGSAPGARRDAVLLAEAAAEMRGIAEAPAEADVGDRNLGINGIGEIGAAALQPAMAQMMRETVMHRVEQLLQIAGGDAVLGRDRGEGQIGVAEPGVDGLADALQQCHLPTRCAVLGARGGVGRHAGDEELRQCQLDRLNLIGGEGFDAVGDRSQQPGENAAGAARARNIGGAHQGARAEQARRQHDLGKLHHQQPEIGFEGQSRTRAGRPVGDIAGREPDAPLALAYQRAALQQQYEPHRIGLVVGAAGDLLRRGGDPGEADAERRDQVGDAAEKAFVDPRRRAQLAQLGQHLAPGIVPLLLGIGLGIERKSLHVARRSSPWRQGASVRRLGITRPVSGGKQLAIRGSAREGVRSPCGRDAQKAARLTR